MKRGLTGWLACLLGMAAAAATAAEHGVILMYHHVDEATPASTSVTPAQFRRHLDYIEDNGFVVVPLPELLAGVYGGGDVVDNAVAITFDDAYESVYLEALPELKSRNMPFTVFVATAAVDQNHDTSLSWEQLRQIAASGIATFGAHSVTHEHLLRGSEHGVTSAWTARVSAEIDDSVERLEKQLPGVAIHSFAYPFGEYSSALQDLLASRGLYGLAQRSGALGPLTPPTAIPRFPMATGYDSTERLATALNARPLPVEPVAAGDALLAEGSALPGTLRFRLAADGPYRRNALACYSIGGETLKVDQAADEFTVAVPRLRAGRNKINCTAPSAARQGEFFWYSHQWILADEEGVWLNY
ncbi:MAG: polysaccharide deacetylase family protein [Chromatocurvus sp.]